MSANVIQAMHVVRLAPTACDWRSRYFASSCACVSTQKKDGTRKRGREGAQLSMCNLISERESTFLTQSYHFSHPLLQAPSCAAKRDVLIGQTLSSMCQMIYVLPMPITTVCLGSSWNINFNEMRATGL